MKGNENCTKFIFQTNPNDAQIENTNRISLVIPQSKGTKRKSFVSLNDSTEYFNSSTKMSISKQNSNRKRPSIFIDKNYNGETEVKKIRFDAYGNEINKGSKTHKVTFEDMISKNNFVEIIIMDSNKQQKKDEVNCNCVCLIF